jgi:hypothetical protein
MSLICSTVMVFRQFIGRVASFFLEFCCPVALRFIKIKELT